MSHDSNLLLFGRELSSNHQFHVQPLYGRRCESLSWLEQLPLSDFFPYPANGAWDVAFDVAFSETVLASFNQSHLDFDGFKALYRSFNTTIGATFVEFDHGFMTTVGVPNLNGDKGGFMYATGWEGGKTLTGMDVWFADAAFAVVQEIDGERKIVEFRESSNIPSSDGVPSIQDWTCQF
ncbi:MAG: hypothetical protein M1821_008342 [Bathelium mastoideum]|nr:MAG: hypothetical protein M1821_008342 [Bathelium mastoideum]